MVYFHIVLVNKIVVEPVIFRDKRKKNAIRDYRKILYSPITSYTCRVGRERVDDQMKEKERERETSTRKWSLYSEIRKRTYSGQRLTEMFFRVYIRHARGCHVSTTSVSVLNDSGS